ncbi:hypothetical protein XENTR_v10001049 [Xenopus tropicalis]|nr:hypothetical protein XENTR_v10001049 [Xenopus tropicalis]
MYCGHVCSSKGADGWVGQQHKSFITLAVTRLLGCCIVASWVTGSDAAFTLMSVTQYAINITETSINQGFAFYRHLCGKGKESLAIPLSSPHKESTNRCPSLYNKIVILFLNIT